MALLGRKQIINNGFDLQILGDDDSETVTFRVTENVKSREFGINNNLIYDVAILQHSDIPFTDTIGNPWKRPTGDTENRSISQELIIGANVWYHSGWTNLDSSLSKKWPPHVQRTGPNQYRVTIQYEPLFSTNFQISQLKARLKQSYSVEVWERQSDGSFNKKDIDGLPAVDQKSFLNINLEKGTQQDDVVKGVDVFEPSYTWSERWTFGPIMSLQTSSGNEIRDRYDVIITEMAGGLNKEKFRGYDPLSVAFLGGVGRNTLPFTWEFDFKFMWRPQVDIVRVPNSNGSVHPSTPIFKSGWTVVDPEFESADGDDDSPKQVIKYIKLHQVMLPTRFEKLGIAEELPLGYSTPFDGRYSLKSKYSSPWGDVPWIGTAWQLSHWASINPL